MPFGFKKEYRNLYQPKTKPSKVEVPQMRFLAIEGAGDPNEVDGAYKHAIMTCRFVVFLGRVRKSVLSFVLFPLNRRMKTSFQIASAFPQVRSLKLQLLSSWRSCWYESGTNRAEVRTRRFWQCSGGSRKRTRRRLPPRASSPYSHGCRCPWRSASYSARRVLASPWGARR